MTKQSFIKGAMILLIAGITNRLLGFIPRITLPRIIGAEGVGIYQLSYPFLIVLLTFISGGIPLAVAKWVAEAQSVGDNRKVKQIFRTAMILSVCIALLLTAIMLFFAPIFIKYVIPDPRVYRSFLIMSPMLLIVAFSAVFRGYFQGKQNMIPSALSQTGDTTIRIVLSLLLAYMFLPYGLDWGAAGAMLGVVIGELGGLCIMLYCYYRDNRKERPTVTTQLEQPAVIKDTRSPLIKLVTLAVPVTGSKLVGSLSYLLESIFTARSLAAAGILTGVATAQYGALQGMIMPLILLPTALTYSLAVSLVPSLAEAAAQKNYTTIHLRLHQSMRISLVAGAPFVVIMFLFAKPICEILYAHGEYAPLLQIIAPIGIFIYLQAPLQATLQALEKPGTALMNTFIGAVIKIFLIIVLASNPTLGIKGAIIAIAVNTVLVTILHGISVKRFIGFHMKFFDFIKVGAAMVITGAFAQYTLMNVATKTAWLNLITACLAALIAYICLMFLMKIIDKNDLSRIPYIRRWF